MTVALTDASPVDPALSDHGRTPALYKGHAAIVITGADDSTNLAVFSAKRQPARRQGPGANRAREVLAHIASVSIVSRNGRFGGVRTGNVHFSAHAGITGIYAPGVRFAGPVNIGNITAFAGAEPVFRLGFTRDTHVVGGDLVQPNGRTLNVSGVSRLRFVKGQRSTAAPPSPTE